MLPRRARRCAAAPAAHQQPSAEALPRHPRKLPPLPVRLRPWSATPRAQPTRRAIPELSSNTLELLSVRTKRSYAVDGLTMAQSCPSAQRARSQQLIERRKYLPTPRLRRITPTACRPDASRDFRRLVQLNITVEILEVVNAPRAAMVPANVRHCLEPTSDRKKPLTIDTGSGSGGQPACRSWDCHAPFKAGRAATLAVGRGPDIPRRSHAASHRRCASPAPPPAPARSPVLSSSYAAPPHSTSTTRPF